MTELLRGKCGRLAGAAITLATIIKGLPLAYNKDLQEGQEPVFDAADTIAGILSVLPSFTKALKFRLDPMKLAATSGYLNAMAAATYLTHKGVPFRKAHEIVGNVVRFALEKGLELDALSQSDLESFSPEFESDFQHAISLQATIDCHDVIGGTATARVQQALLLARERAKKRNLSGGASVAEALHADIRIHKAHLQDARNIFDLVNSLSGDGHAFAAQLR